MSDQAIKQVADKIFEAHRIGKPCAPVRDLLPEGALDQAYAAQEINTKRWLAAGRRLVGRKIGLTSLAVQKQLGVDQPDYGMLFDDMAVPDGWEIGRKQLIQPKVEAEVAFVLERDLDHERLTIADILRAVAFALPAIEVVDSRISRLEDRHSRHHRRQCLVGSLCARRDAEEAQGSRSARRRHGDGKCGRAGLGRRGRGLPRRSAVGHAVAGENHGPRRASAAGGRHRVVGRARPDGAGQMGRCF